MAPAFEEEEDCSVLDDCFWNQIKDDRNLHGSSSCSRANDAGNPCEELVCSQVVVQGDLAGERLPVGGPDRNWEGQGQEGARTGGTLGCHENEGVIEENSCEPGGYWDNGSSLVGCKIPDKVVHQSHSNFDAQSTAVVGPVVNRSAQGQIDSDGTESRLNGAASVEEYGNHCVTGTGIPKERESNGTDQNEGYSWTSYGEGVCNPKYEAEYVPDESMVGCYDAHGVGSENGYNVSSSQAQHCEMPGFGNWQNDVTYQDGREMGCSADGDHKHHVYDAGINQVEEVNLLKEQASYHNDASYRNDCSTCIPEHAHMDYSSMSAGNQANYSTYADNENCQWSYSDVEFILGVVNIPADVSKFHVVDLFRTQFEIVKYREKNDAMKNAAGIKRTVECIAAPKDWSIGKWSWEDLRYTVLKFWFESTVAGSFRSSSQMWLHELPTKNTIRKGRTAKVKIVGLDVGSFYDKGHFVNRAQFEEAMGSEYCLYLDFSSRSVVIMIDNRFTIEFSTRDMQSFVIVDFSFDSCAIYLTLKNPPKMFRVTHWEPAHMVFEPDPDTKIRKNKIGNLPVSVFAQCQTYKLQVESTSVCPAICNRNVRAVLNLLSTVDKEIYYAEIKAMSPEVLLPSYQFGIPTSTKHHSSWGVNLAWLALTSTNGFVIDRFHDDFFKKLDLYSAPIVESALYAMAPVISTDAFIDSMTALEIGLRKGSLAGDLGNLGDPSLHCKLPRVIVTPTRLLFFEPDVIQTNRVLRKFGNEHHFLRVSIRDDSFAKISSIYGNTDEILDYIENLLNSGFKIGKKNFQFLGASNSQVREHGCWFVEMEEHRDTARLIREFVGELSGIRNVAKYLSRLGQGFSTSTETVKIEVPDYQLIPDITRNGFCFTDGIGSITPDLGERIATHLGLPYIPCGFQIRFGGAKGVVTIDNRPELKVLFPGKCIFIRESMLKYNSQHTVVEALQCKAAPQELYLNQQSTDNVEDKTWLVCIQLIMLMSYLGVPDSILLKLMKGVLDTMSQMFIDKSMAYSKMHSVQCGVDWGALKAAGFDLTSEPYLQSMLMALYRVQMQEIRTKSRIPIDPSLGRVLLGVADETSTLQYGQVFIQISCDLDNALGSSRILQQTVLVGKSPCLHPGDVRTFQAVDCPKLRHMRDCIVFPIKGHRPHPNEMSGSDLDGDMYHAIWDPDLLPRIKLHEPMLYPSANEAQTSGEITVPMMIGFLRQSIQFDCIGQIDNTHKALADIKGLSASECITLAKLHSEAVDAPKTGKWVSIPSNIRKSLKSYPDFMMKQDRPSYPSDRILGQMFRECKKHMSSSSLDLSALGCSDPELDGRFAMPGYEEFLEDAREKRQQYNLKLEGLLRMYGIHSEAELMTGFIEKYHEKLGREKTDIAAMAASVRQNLMKMFREEFFKDESIKIQGTLDHERATKKAAAWYYVTYSKDEEVEKYEVGELSVRFLSFPWIMSDYLMIILKKNLELKNCVARSIHEDIEDSIWNHFETIGYYLVKTFRDHCRLSKEVNRVLQSYQKGYYAVLYGLSATCLFDSSSMVDLLICDPMYKMGLSHDLYKQKAVLRDVKDVLQKSCTHCSIIRTPGLARLKFNLRRNKKNSLGCISVNHDHLLQSLVLVSYIYYNAWLLPLLHVVVRWGEATGLVGAGDTCLLDPLLLCYMVIGFALDKQHAQPVDAAQLKWEVETGGIDWGYFSPELWEDILYRLDAGYKDHPPLGILLIDLFRYAEFVTSQVHSELQIILGSSLFSEIQNVNKRGVDMIKEEMLRAFHRLCMHHNVDALMEVLSREESFFIWKDDCRSMIGSEQYYARLLMTVTDAKVEVNTNLWCRTPGMIFKIVGTNAAIQTAKRQIDYFKRRGQHLSYIQKEFPGVSCLWTKRASLLIFEGSSVTSKKNKVVFEDYSGIRHHEHDNTGIYLPRVYVIEPASGKPSDAHGDEFDAFKDHFLKRFKLINNRTMYNFLANGPVQLEVKFGRLYTVHPPKPYLELPDGVVVDDITECIDRAYKKGVINHPMAWHDELYRQPNIRSGVDSGLQAGFYPRLSPVITLDQLISILRHQGFEDSGYEEGHLLTYHGKHATMVAKYDCNRRLVQTINPPVKWMVTDVVRDSSTRLSDGCDIRFEITSQRHNSRDNKELYNALILLNGVVAVNKPMMKKAAELRSYKKWEFFQTDAPFSGVRLYVEAATICTRPRRYGNKNEHTKFEFPEQVINLYIVHDLMEFHSQADLPESFVSEVWKQSWNFSSTLLEHIGSKSFPKR